MSGIQITKLHTFQGHKDAVYTLEPMKDQAAFFSGAGDGMVVKWNFERPDQGQLVAKMKNSVYALHCVSDMNLLIVGQNFEGIHLIDLNLNKEQGSLAISDSAIFDIKQVQSNLIVATGSGTVFIVDLVGLQILERLEYSTKSARCVSISEQTGEFAVGYSDHVVRIFDSSSFKLKHELTGHTNSVFTVAYHPHVPVLLTAGRDAHLKLWNLEQGYSIQQSIAAHMYAINHLEFSPNGHHFVTCSMDKSIKVWDARLFKLLKVIDKFRYAGHGTSVNKLYWSPHSQKLASCSDDRTITIWDLKI